MREKNVLLSLPVVTASGLLHFVRYQNEMWSLAVEKGRRLGHYRPGMVARLIPERNMLYQVSGH